MHGAVAFGDLLLAEFEVEAKIATFHGHDTPSVGRDIRQQHTLATDRGHDTQTRNCWGTVLSPNSCNFYVLLEYVAYRGGVEVHGAVAFWDLVPCGA